ncbi:hypothetical protein PS2_007411 [Malus domestica]
MFRPAYCLEDISALTYAALCHLEELRQIFTHELRVVVGDDGLRDAKSVNDVPPYEALYVLLNRGCHGLCFYLFSEVVSCHDHHAFAPSSLAGD